jgi:hypothetical protein
MATMTPDEAAEALRRSTKLPEWPEGTAPGAEPAPTAAPPEPPAEEEPAEESEPLEVKPRRPVRIFKWISDKEMTVDDWLAGTAVADIEVFPGIVFRFREASNKEMREADAFVNGMGPEFIMLGLPQQDGIRDDRPRGEQWARARNVGMVCITVTHMGSHPWPPGGTFGAKFDVIDNMGHVKVDRLIQAMSEFTEQLAWNVREADLGNS